MSADDRRYIRLLVGMWASLILAFATPREDFTDYMLGFVFWAVAGWYFWQLRGDV